MSLAVANLTRNIFNMTVLFGGDVISWKLDTPFLLWQIVCIVRKWVWLYFMQDAAATDFDSLFDILRRWTLVTFINVWHIADYMLSGCWYNGVYCVGALQAL